jgi:glycosyltransferase involved in cell wall biosynthesis
MDQLQLTPSHHFKVAVVVPCYGQVAFVGEAVQSILRQCGGNWGCAIVYDNHECGSIISSLVGRDKRFFCLPTTGESVSTPRARNLGVRALSSDYVVTLDADDILGSKFFERAAAELDSRSDVKLVYGEARLFGDCKGPFHVPEFSPELLCRRNMIYSAAMFRRKDFDAVGGFDEALHMGLEDWELWLSILKRGGRAVRLTTIELYYRQHGGSKTASSHRGEWENAKAYISKKHKDFFDAFWASRE